MVANIQCVIARRRLPKQSFSNDKEIASLGITRNDNHVEFLSSIK